MTEKNEALRLSDALEISSNHGMRREAATELRRLHAENEKFRKHIEGQNTELDKLIPMAERLEAQRDALLKMLKDVLPVAEDASESLGRFCSNEGWAQEDMDRMDNVDGMLPLIRAAIAAVEGEKT